MRDYLTSFLAILVIIGVIILGAFFLVNITTPQEADLKFKQICVPDGYEFIDSHSPTWAYTYLILEKDGEYFETVLQYAENGEC